MWRSPLSKEYWEPPIWPAWSSLEYLHTVICAGLRRIRPTKLNSHSPVALTTGIVRNWRDITDIRGYRGCPIPKSLLVNSLFFNSVSPQLFIMMFLFRRDTSVLFCLHALLSSYSLLWFMYGVPLILADLLSDKCHHDLSQNRDVSPCSPQPC